MFHAISHQTKGRVATATPGCGQQEHSTDKGKEAHTDVCEQISGNFTEQYGRGTQRSPGSISLPRRRQDLHLSPRGDAPEHTEESTFRENAKRLQGGRHRNPQDINGKGPGDPCANPTGVFTKCGNRNNASDEQSSNDEGNGRKHDRARPDQVFDDGVSGYRMSDPAHYTTTTKMQVTHVALQTDSYDTLYVTKNTLTAYTIAIVQNAQALQYDQMHIALQTARNQASLETPLRAEELMSTHFNFTVLSNETDITKMPDAQKPEANTLDTGPTASTANEETYIKIPSRNYAANSNSKKQHPTGAIAPTCRREYGLVNGIPAGYETDDSWDNDSHTHECDHRHTHTHNIVPLLALHTWNNCLHRGREQPPRQNNNINMQTGHAPYP